MVTCFSIVEQLGVEGTLKIIQLAQSPVKLQPFLPLGREEAFGLKGGWGVRLAV